VHFPPYQTAHLSFSFPIRMSVVIPQSDEGEDEIGSLPPSSTVKRTKSSGDGTSYIQSRSPDEPDWYGNLPLHHICAQMDLITENPKVRIKEFIKVLDSYPQAARMQNQFGRLPIHYALDRSKPEYKIVRALVEEYPEGVSEAGGDNLNAYDLAVRWKHPDKIVRLLLKADPSLDWRRHISLTYGSVIGFFCNIFRSDPNPKNISIRSIHYSFGETEDPSMDSNIEKTGGGSLAIASGNLGSTMTDSENMSNTIGNFSQQYEIELIHSNSDGPATNLPGLNEESNR
jgi:hypothetical protein